MKNEKVVMRNEYATKNVRDIKTRGYHVGPRAKLFGAQLRGANLGLIDLRGADLRRADLRDVNFTGADLRDADLEDALLSGATFALARVKLPKDYELRDGIARRTKKSDRPGANQPRPVWYTYAWFTRDGQPHPAYRRLNFQHRLMRLQDLLAWFQVNLSSPEKQKGAHFVAIWEGAIKESVALHDPTKIPVKYILEDGSILDRLP